MNSRQKGLQALDEVRRENRLKEIGLALLYSEDESRREVLEAEREALIGERGEE